MRNSVHTVGLSHVYKYELFLDQLFKYRLLKEVLALWSWLVSHTIILRLLHHLGLTDVMN
jgi:hypothetical protein